MEVSCRATRVLLEAAESVGIDRTRVAEATTFSLAHLTSPSQRIDWASFVKMIERIDDIVGGDGERIRAIGHATVAAPGSAFLRRIGQMVVSPRQIYYAGGNWVAPVFFPCVRVTTEDLGPGRLRVVGELAAGLEPCATFFRICTAALEAQPRLLGLADAIITNDITPTRAVSIVSLPRSGSLFDRVRRGARAALGQDDLIALFEAQRDELDRSFQTTLRASDDYRSFLDNLPDMVLIQRRGTIVYVNHALVTTLGYDSAQELVGRPNLDVVQPSMRAAVEERMRRPPLDAGLPALSEFVLVRKDGREIVVECAPAQEVSFGGAPARLIAARDVTERVTMQKQLALADRMASLGVLAAGVAHEINNPLAFAMGSVELAGAQIARGDIERAKDALGTAMEGLERVRRIVKDLKTLSRADDERLSPVDVRSALETTLTLASQQIARRAKVVREYGVTPPAMANAARLGQVFLNVVVNALEAMPEATPDKSELRVRTFVDEEGRVAIEIEDNGEGIAEEHLATIFEPFFTTKPVGSGTGLGLAVCRQIVTSLRGTITARSTRGHGTTFRVTLPAAAEVAKAKPDTVAPRSASPRRTAKVLVIDDEPQFANVLKQVLAPHEVAIASSGRAALPLIAGSSFDVIVCDLMMPDLTGPELHAELARTRPELCERMIFMTGGAFSPSTRDFLARTANRCLEKPFDVNQLLDAVEARIARDASAPSGSGRPLSP